MAQELIEKFEKVNKLYEEVIPKIQEAFNQLKLENNDTVEELNRELLLMNYDLKTELESLTSLIEKKCEEKNVEKKIPKLVQFYSVEEKEKVMAGLQTAIHYERTWKKTKYMYIALAQAKYETADTLVEMWRHTAYEEGKGKRMFINKKL